MSHYSQSVPPYSLMPRLHIEASVARADERDPQVHIAWTELLRAAEHLADLIRGGPNPETVAREQGRRDFETALEELRDRR